MAVDGLCRRVAFVSDATDSRRPGNADSIGLAYATNADRLTFASNASNLSARRQRRPSA